MIRENIVMDSDSYKYSHFKQYPKNMLSMYDYAEARTPNKKIVFFGIMYIIKRSLMTTITQEMVDEAYEFSQVHGIPFDKDGWDYIANELNGKLPIRIRAVKEGTVIPTQTVLFTVESTDTKVPWVASWVETILMRVWYPVNVATESFNIKQVLEEYANQTADNTDVSLQFHNFGSRGSSSSETAGIGGMAQLVVFKGSDNFQSMKYIKEFYNGNYKDFGAISMSIPASEHSSVTSWTKEKEFDMVANYIDEHKGNFIVACVADSYDYFNFVDKVTKDDFKEKIESDEYPIFVIRPDSGKPEEIVPKTLDIMEKNDVGYTINSKGYKVFNKYRIIWGDGINISNIRIMLEILKQRGYSSENIAFGMGGALMQGNETTSNNRDTYGFAIKCSSIQVANPIITQDDPDNKWNQSIIEDRDVFKDPITAKSKKSKKGKVTTYYDIKTNEYFVDNVGKDFEYATDILQTVFENGEIVKDISFDEIRGNIS